MEYQALKYIYKASGKAGAYTLLLLHGTGGDETDLLSLGERFGPEVNLLSVRGNVLEHGMPRFFKRLGMGIFDEKDLEFRTAELHAFLQHIAAEKGFDPAKIIALGYSNGANIAGALLIKYPDFLAGAILLRPMPPFKVPAKFVSNKQPQVLMLHGKTDPTVNPEATENYALDLKAAGMEVTEAYLAAGHNLTRQDLEEAIEWFGKIWDTKE